METDLPDQGLDIITPCCVLCWNLLESYWLGWMVPRRDTLELQSHISSLTGIYVGVGLNRISAAEGYSHVCAWEKEGRVVIISLCQHWKKKRDTASFGCSSAKLGKWGFFFSFSSLNCCFCKRAARESFLWCRQWPLCPAESEQQCVCVCGGWTAKLRYIALEKQTHLLYTLLHTRLPTPAPITFFRLEYIQWYQFTYTLIMMTLILS